MGMGQALQVNIRFASLDTDAQNAPFGAALMVMGTACHNVPNGGYSLVTGTNADHLG
jgi:hypothetical protein